MFVGKYLSNILEKLILSSCYAWNCSLRICLSLWSLTRMQTNVLRHRARQSKLVSEHIYGIANNEHSGRPVSWHHLDHMEIWKCRKQHKVSSHKLPVYRICCMQLIHDGTGVIETLLKNFDQMWNLCKFNVNYAKLSIFIFERSNYC
jgi:hypothetical protein